MEKLKREFEVDYNLDWEYSVEISKIREDLDELEKLGATHVKIESGMFYDCDYLTIDAVSERFETEEEQKERINQERLRKEEVERRELEQLKRLQEKYKK